MSVLLPEHRERAIGAGQEWAKARSGLYLPPTILDPTPPLGMDLFAGAGGFSLGMHQAGFHVVAASEWWPVAVQTYLCNLGAPSTLVYVGHTAAPDATKRERRLFAARAGEFITAVDLFEILTLPKEQRDHSGPGSGWIGRAHRDHALGECCNEVPFEDEDGAAKTCEQRHGPLTHVQACEVFFCCDVRELSGDFIAETLDLPVGGFDVVFGGPPCQGFSTANAATHGPAARHDERNQLVFEFARLVCELKPKTMVMENVPAIVNMVTPEGVPVIDALSLILEQGGMGEYEALRRSLAANAGAGAIVKGASRPGRKTDRKDDDEALEDQLAMAVGG